MHSTRSAASRCDVQKEWPALVHRQLGLDALICAAGQHDSHDGGVVVAVEVDEVDEASSPLPQTHAARRPPAESGRSAMNLSVDQAPKCTSIIVSESFTRFMYVSNNT